MPTAEQTRPAELSVTQAAARAGVSEKTVRRWIATGALKASREKTSGRVVILAEDLDAATAREPIVPR